MEERSVNTQQGVFKPAAHSAILISVVLIIFSLIFYLAGYSGSALQAWLNFFILVAGLTYGVISFRNQNLGGFISYGKALKFQVIAGLLVGAVMGVFAFILYSYVAPDLLEKMKENTLAVTYQFLEQTNPDISDSELRLVENLQLALLKPYWLAIRSIIGYTFQALLIGLIVSIFIKRKDPEVKEQL